MRIGCYQACACITSCFEYGAQAFAAFVIKCDEVRRDPEAFQKTCLVALAAIQGINIHFQKNYLPKFISVLNHAPAFDFYGFCRLPWIYLHPYTAARLDEYDLLNQLEVILCQNWHLGSPDKEGRNRDPLVYQFAKEQLSAFLEEIQDKNLDFCTEEEVKTTLSLWFEKRLEKNPKKDFDPHEINLQDLKIKLKESSWMESLREKTFALIDIACVPDFLQGWGLIDLSSCTQFIGRIPLIAWMTKYSLDNWVWGMLCFGHGLNVIDACHSLLKGGLTPGEAKNAKWVIAASTAESIYSLSILQRKDFKVINCLALIAKSLGLIAYLVTEKPTYFNDDKTAST